MISLIACVDKNNGIGKDNNLLCKLKDDMNLFKKYTTEKYVVMGRKTWESIGMKPLKNRFNVILSNSIKSTTTDIENKHEQMFVIANVDDILEFSRKFPEKEIMIIGGQQIYEQFMEHADKIYLSTINHEFDADSFFPIINYDEWNLHDYKSYNKNENNDYDFQFKIFTRKVI